MITAPTNDEDIPCLWYQVVQNKPSQKRQGRIYEPSFTVAQQQAMLSVMDEVVIQIKERFGDSESLLTALASYRDYIANHLRLDSNNNNNNSASLEIQ